MRIVSNRCFCRTIQTNSERSVKKIIIAVHGMRNKPDKRVLSRWWKKSIHLGLEAIDRPRPFFRFAMVYWANWLYPKP